LAGSAGAESPQHPVFTCVPHSNDLSEPNARAGREFKEGRAVPLDGYRSERVACRNSWVAAHQPVQSFQSYRLGLHSTCRAHRLSYRRTHLAINVHLSIWFRRSGGISAIVKGVPTIRLLIRQNFRLPVTPDSPHPSARYNVPRIRTAL
jgi:hypothetical protein